MARSLDVLSSWRIALDIQQFYFWLGHDALADEAMLL
jgi:hypothetical protein